MPVLNALQSHKQSATDALRHAVMALQQAHCETASLDARLLLQHIVGVSREELLADHRLKLTAAQDAAYHELVEKRKSRQPVAQLIGKREFWGRNFKVTSDTLDPRADSETLIEVVLEWVNSKNTSLLITNHQSPITILDLGTGTGCLLLTLLAEWENARGIGVDVCEKALGVAQENAVRLGLQDRAQFVQSCWGEKVQGKFDIIISNPPYIPTATIATLAPEVSEYEPKSALDGGKDGLDCYRAIIAQLPKLLAKGGLAVLEIGMGQEEDVRKIVAGLPPRSLGESGLRVADVKTDLSGIARCLLLNQTPQ